VNDKEFALIADLVSIEVAFVFGKVIKELSERIDKLEKYIQNNPH
jgi:hypothetical protein